MKIFFFRAIGGTKNYIGDVVGVEKKKLIFFRPRVIEKNMVRKKH
jgi:hypothetical protein